MKPENYKCNDLIMAAYLVMRGFRCCRIVADEERPGLFLFLFDRDERLLDAAISFQKKEGSVEPKAFMRTVRTLKMGAVK